MTPPPDPTVDGPADPWGGRFVVVPASYVYLVRGHGSDREVLLQLRHNTGYMDGHWAAGAAGHVESGETAYDAAHRELVEELGVDQPDLHFVTTMQRTQGAAPIDERVDFFFTCETWTGEPQLLEPEKAAELRWCRLDALPSPVVPHELRVLEGIHRGDLPAYVTMGFGSA